MKLPKNISDNLKCGRCEGTLSISPVMVDKIGTQICGRCFNLLPEDERRNFVRELGFETLASLFRFRCRYSSEGCTFEYPFNRGLEHEKFCPYRYRYSSLRQTVSHLELNKNHSSLSEERLPFFSSSEKLVESSPKSKTLSITSPSEKICSEVSISWKQLDKSNVLTYDVEVAGNEQNGYYLLVANPDEEEAQSFSKENSSKVRVTGAIAMKKSMENIYGRVSVKSSREDVYESIGELPQEPTICAHCRDVAENEVYQCTYGHTICKNCRGRVCDQCNTRISASPYYYCKNMTRGCTTKMKITELTTHEFDCEFGEFTCPVAECTFKNVLSYLIKHLQESHGNVVSVKDVVKRTALLKDELWIQIVFNSIFVCKYFWYEEHDEFVAEYFGSEINALKYKFEVEVEGKMNKRICKNQVCQGWNAKYLDEAVIITDKELQKINSDVLNFDYTFKIMPTN